MPLWAKLYVSALKHLWGKSDEMILVRNNLMWKLYVLSIYHTFKYPSVYSGNSTIYLSWELYWTNNTLWYGLNKLNVHLSCNKWWAMTRENTFISSLTYLYNKEQKSNTLYQIISCLLVLLSWCLDKLCC